MIWRMSRMEKGGFLDVGLPLLALLGYGVEF